MSYVDGFVVSIPAGKIDLDCDIASKAGKVWKEHGALDYRECVGDDLDVKEMLSFRKLAKVKPGETVVFAWNVCKSGAHRDKVNAKVMKDPRLAKMIEPDAMPFAVKRMACGGFKTLVGL